MTAILDFFKRPYLSRLKSYRGEILILDFLRFGNEEKKSKFPIAFWKDGASGILSLFLKTVSWKILFTLKLKI